MKKFIIYKLIQNWRDGLKKFTIIFLVALLIFSSSSIVVKSGFKIWPGKLTITMNEWYDQWEETKYNKIYVTNPYSHGINVSAQIDHPSYDAISDDYYLIPDLSWVKVYPKSQYLPPQSTKPFEISIIVPKNNQSNHFNESWETWVTFNSDLYPGGLSGMNFQVELSVKLFINTPEGEKTQTIYYYLIFLIFFILIMIALVVFYYIRKKKGFLIQK